MKKLDNREIDALVQKICTEKLIEQEKNKKEAFEKYKNSSEYKNTLKKIESYLALQKEIVVNSYHKDSKENLIEQQFDKSTKSTYKKNWNYQEKEKVKNIVILAQIDCKDLEDLIKKVKSQV